MSRPGSKLTSESKIRMVNIMNDRDSTHQYFWQMKQKYKISADRIRQIYNQGILLEKAGKLNRSNNVKMTLGDQEIIGIKTYELSTLKENQYQCENCGGIFERGQSDEKALEELSKEFPNTSIDNCVLVCDNCYKEIMDFKKDIGAIP